MLDAAMAGKIEDGLLAEDRRIEVAGVNQQIVIFGLGFRDDLPLGIDDEAVADQRKAILPPALATATTQVEF